MEKFKSKIRRISKKTFTFFCDLVFPIKCLGCGYPEKWLCERCFYALRKKSLAPIQEIKGSKIKKIIAPYHYKDPLVEKIVRAYKYHFVKDLKSILGELINAEIKEFLGDQKARRNFILIPVPLHKKRLRWRGFNQSFLIASEVQKKFHIGLKTKVLKRVRHTTAQALLLPGLRKKNLKNAFWAKRCSALDGKVVLLVDDVCTTGATLNECAKAICRENKPAGVWGLTLARG